MIKKGLIAGLANLIFGLLLNWIISVALPSLAQEYQNTEIFRAWDDPLMLIYFAYPFLLGIVLAYVWNVLENKLRGEGSAKAMDFAKMYFVIATIPGMFISYTSMQLSFMMILLWTLTGFLQVYIAGLIFVKVK